MRYCARACTRVRVPVHCMYIAPRTCVYACVRVSPQHEHVCVRLVCMCASLLASSVRGEACEASLCVCAQHNRVCTLGVCAGVQRQRRQGDAVSGAVEGGLIRHHRAYGRHRCVYTFVCVCVCV